MAKCREGQLFFMLAIKFPVLPKHNNQWLHQQFVFINQCHFKPYSIYINPLDECITMYLTVLKLQLIAGNMSFIVSTNDLGTSVLVFFLKTCQTCIHYTFDCYIKKQKFTSLKCHFYLR